MSPSSQLSKCWLPAVQLLPAAAQRSTEPAPTVQFVEAISTPPTSTRTEKASPDAEFAKAPGAANSSAATETRRDGREERSIGSINDLCAR